MRFCLALLAPALALAGETSFTVAGISAVPQRWNKQANLETIERHARRAAAGGARLVITPESFLDGYLANDKQYVPFATRDQYFAAGEAIDGPMLTRLRLLAGELKIYLLVGFAERRGDSMFNTAALFSPEAELVTRYSKTHTADDEPYNTKGTVFPVVQTPLGRLGTLICMDRQLPETSRILAVKGAQIVLVPSYGGYGEMNDVMMRTRAYENGVWLAFVHPKRCLFIDPRGTIVAKDDGSGDQLVTARIVLQEKPRPGPIRHRRPEIYGEILRTPQ